MNSIWKHTSLGLLCPLLLTASIKAETTAINLPQGGEPPKEAAPSADTALVQVALLLDTSGSMKGLIDQARCQLWNVVSELAKAERGGQPIALHIGVYEYGSNRLSSGSGFIRQVQGFTEDLDQVSAGLFSLTTDGSEEFCGQVIQEAIEGLEWSEDPNVYKVAFIAGNESFDQGPVSFGEVLSPLNGRSITLNTIFCGKTDKVDAPWRSAAGLAGGLFSRIDHNHHLPAMKTPYDERMRELNKMMNDTFVWFGEGAEEAAKNQRTQDENAQKMSDHAFAARMSAKVGHLYHHVHHDLVDAIAHGTVDMATMPEEKMPEMLRKMPVAKRMEFLEEKTKQRQAVRRQMADVITDRHQFLEAKMSDKVGRPADGSLVLGDALVLAVRGQAEGKGYVFAK